MKCFVTGATGFIGNRLVEQLLSDNNEVHVLVRSAKKLEVPASQKLFVFEGGLENTEAINRAISGCDVVYHLAAYANIWSRDKTLAYVTNFIGTQNILEAALKNKIKKVVFTSSAATLPPSNKNELVDESVLVSESYTTDYEITKRQAELLCFEYCQKGLDVVVVNPTRLYGPGLLNKSNSVTIMIKKYLNGTWHFIPGSGKQTGNYVFIDDVVEGHILAMKRGVPGEKYILGGSNVSFNDFFKILKSVSTKNRFMIHIPFSLMLFFSKFELFMAEHVGKPPLITPAWVRRYNQNRLLSSQKAIRQLGYRITPLEEGFQKTLEWLKSD